MCGSVSLNLKCHWTSFRQSGLTNVFHCALIALIYLVVTVVSQQVFVGTLLVCRGTSKCALFVQFLYVPKNEKKKHDML